MGFSYACEEVVTQMASRIQGITVEIGGDTTKLSKALESVNKSIKGTQSGLKDVNKLLKLDPSNVHGCMRMCPTSRVWSVTSWWHRPLSLRWLNLPPMR